MNRTFYLLSVLLISLFAVSCQKETSVDTLNNPPDNPTGVSGSFKAKIDGQQWVADKATGAYRMQGLINISGISNDKKLFSITLTDSGVHTYTLNQDVMNAVAYVDSSLANPVAFTTNASEDAGGSLTITEIDTAKKTISGTFEIIVFRQLDNQKRTITEGAFTNISYSTTLPPLNGTPAGTDTLNAKINGALWTPTVISGISTGAQTGNNQIFISATDATITKTIGLAFPNNIIPGTYNIGTLGDAYYGQYNPDTDPTHSKASTSGTLQILEHNTSTKRIRGKFSFKAAELLTPANTADITEGYFSVTYL